MAQPPDAESELALRDPDVRLMLRVKAGDEAAFSELVAAYQNRLVNIFYHLVQNRETAEDLAQEVFLRIYRSRHGYTPTAKFATWLFRIANNLASNTRRTQGRRREVDLNRDGEGDERRPEERLLTDKSALMPTRQLDRREMQQVVQAALGELNGRQRLAVVLHKFEEMSYADIASTMELSAAAVKSLLSRARERLREILEPYVKMGLVALQEGPSDSEASWPGLDAPATRAE